MNWWGKIVGAAFGFMVGDLIGLLIGAFIGHQFDKGLRLLEQRGSTRPVDSHSRRSSGWSLGGRQRIQGAFFDATFSVMGHVAKADGQVTRDEIEAAEELIKTWRLSPQMRQQAIELFRQGKSSSFDLDGALDRLRVVGFGRQILLRVFVEIQLRAALADGALHPEEREILLHICRRLGIPAPDFEAMAGAARAEQHYGGATGRSGMTLDEAYATLEVTPSASDDEVKRAFRKLISRHHPDKLIAKGLPPEMVQVATEKSQEISSAYDLIEESRKKS